MNDLEDILAELKAAGSARNREGMARYGINVERAFGMPLPPIRRIAKRIGKDHELARRLWGSGWHEAQILAFTIDDPKQVTKYQMNTWARDFDSWDITDLCCVHLFRKTPFAHEIAVKWCGRKAEFVKRAGFAMIATLAVHDKKADDAVFKAYLSLIEREAPDERNFVKKAVNWALRQIGKRNRRLNKLAIAAARRIDKQDTRPARWIAKDAIRELTSEKILARLKA